MKLVFLATASIIALGACGDTPPTCGGIVEQAPILLTKEGFPIIDDQAPLSIPCPGVTPPTTSTPPVVVPPIVPPVEPPVEPPVDELPDKGNNGHGNLDDPAPGNSGSHNNAENSDNSGNGNSGNGKGGKPFDPANDD